MKSFSNPRIKKDIPQIFIQVNKLNVIYRNIESFLNHWKITKVAQLVTPPQSRKYGKIIEVIWWTGLFTATVGGILTLTGHRIAGGSISTFFPLFGALILLLRGKNEVQKQKWEDFLKASEKLGDDLDELLIIISSLQNFLLSEKAQQELKILRDKVYNFLKKYDKNSNQKIDITELKIKQFSHDLRKKWGQRNYKARSLHEIMLSIQSLQKEMLK
ncbi:MAG: hypothetical protein I3270_00645 [Candidatus Moeniiplasma glomeromycotorum]|nr:hypothetical protein [Candidatus Moeniiplasma glomeromycotorum]MCE8162198.1 hypothetical protein [Candidatus Moeniiplasma glomeromycotorum]MCE8166146.1 hypothetical protein [Candidatus Moeniiplasma glomeromycotorum]MCE8166597.1 hypothetical protein [Candidatus Moeniiplasma glomeromycotorum]